MKAFTSAITKISKKMHWVSGVTVWVIMALTLVDVIMRHFGHPIVGSFEIISFLGAIVVGLAVPYTSLLKGHICVDFLIDRFPKNRRAVLYVTTRILGMFLFFVLGSFFFVMAWDLYMKGEVSSTVRLPFYPIAIALGLSFFLQVFVLTVDILRTYGGDYE
jgi:TRAP-type C4-dicarboxylate transport system permease small subunit